MTNAMRWAAAAAVAVAMAAMPAQAEESISGKLKAMIDGMSGEQQEALLTLLGSSMGEGDMKAEPMTPEEALEQYTTRIIEAAKESDLDALMEILSDDFMVPQVGGKEELRTFLEGVLDQGIIDEYIDSVEIYTEDAEFEEEDGELIVYPVDVEGDFGMVTLEFRARMEDGIYKLTGIEIYGI